MSLNLGSLLANAARKFPRETAVIYNDVRYTYAALDAAVRKFAADLIERGLEPGQRVAVVVPNVPEFTIADFGVLYAGGVAGPMSTLFVAGELAYQFQDCDARALVLHGDCTGAGLEAFRRSPACKTLYTVGEVAGAETAGDVRPFAAVLKSSKQADLYQSQPDDTSVILYTSGTTGKSKGAELSHFNLYYNAQLICERTFGVWPEEINVFQPGDVGLAALPLYHTFGQTNVQNGMLFGGGAVSYMKRFDPAEAIRLIARDRVTFFAGVPTMYIAILHDSTAAGADFSSLKYCASGGAPMPIEVKQQFAKRFGVRLQEGYGLTETSPLATMQSPRDTEKGGTIGKPIDGIEIKIYDEHDREVPQGERGEVVIRGHNIMKGYLNRPEATAEALRGGWFHSGDVGYIDEDGDIHIVDRKKDMILRGGFNVYPREIEEVLYQHPCIAEAAVIGIPDDRLGEEVKAVVALKPGAKATVEEIVAHCKEHVAAYKYPRVVEIRPELPKGPTGKLLKRALREEKKQ